MKKYLIIGNKGQLGREFASRLSSLNYDFLGVDIEELDITSEEQVYDLFNRLHFDSVINCAAYNLVDEAERDSTNAFLVNAASVANLANACLRHNSFLVHFGSDYVFDGKKENGLYTEEDAVNPINRYGESKLKGEEILCSTMDNYLLCRLSWVYGEGHQNFIYKFLSWAKSNAALNISSNEVSVPTSTATIVDVVMKALDMNLTGLYHLTNSGYCSRYEWARAIAKILGFKTLIRPVSMEIFNLPAKRPIFSAMSNNKISTELGYSIPAWEEALALHLRNMH